MDKFNDLLQHTYFSIIVWDNKICTYTNNKIPNVNKDMKYETYIEKYQNLAHNYTKLFVSQQDQYIVVENQNITLHYLCDNIYYEIRYYNKYPYDYHTLLSISNKLRSPLTNIIGILTLCEDEKLTQTHKKYMNIIKKSSYQIVALANDIIDFINLSQNKIELKNSKFIFGKFIANIISGIDSKLPITYKFGKDVPDIINVDSARLKQILNNILQNAVTYTEIGSITLQIELTEHISENTYNILFKIKDTGCGISDKKREHVNNILGIGNNTNTQNMQPYNICGFGLLVAKYLVGLMGGKIWYDTLVDMGTTFYFNIICTGI